MKEDWKECKLGDVVEINQNSFSEKENWLFVNYLDTGSITENKISEIQYINLIDEKLPSRAKRKVKKNSIIYSTVRPNQKHFGIIKSFPENFLVSTGFAVLDVNEKLANPDFIYYYLIQNENTESLHAIAEQTTSAYPAIKPSDIADISINLPPLATQQKIAQILSSLDDKIELNNKINDNLEQQAQAIFKSWFVDFEPFGGKMPKGWKMGKLSDLITVKYGKDHKKLEDGSYPVYGSGGIMRYVDKFLYDKESVLIPRKGTLNNVFYINEPFWSVDTMFYTEMTKENLAKFVYFFVKGKDLNSMNAGSAVPSMTTEILNAIEVVIPSDEYLEKFENIVSPMFKQIKQCIIENENLASIRDTLLPKLMSGEIGVDEVKV